MSVHYHLNQIIMTIETSLINGQLIRVARIDRDFAYGGTTLQAISNLLGLIQLKEWAKSI